MSQLGSEPTDELYSSLSRTKEPHDRAPLMPLPISFFIFGFAAQGSSVEFGFIVDSLFTSKFFFEKKHEVVGHCDEVTLQKYVGHTTRVNRLNPSSNNDFTTGWGGAD